MSIATSHISSPIIGIHRSPLTQKFGMPRQPNLVAVPSQIKMLAPYNTPDAFAGLDAFSHLWVVWQTHGNREQASFKAKVRPPRLGGNNKLGVFATRSTYRPSNLGLSVVTLERVETNSSGVMLHITGADMVDGTPIIDIKPYVAYSDALPDAVSGFAPEAPDTKSVEICPDARIQFEQLVTQKVLLSTDLAIIQALIAQDPRPAYRQDEAHVPSVMRYRTVDVEFVMDNKGRIVMKSFKAIRCLHT